MGAKRTVAKKPLPFFGPISYYLPIKDGCPCTDGLTGERRLIAQAELRSSARSAANVHNRIVVVYEKLHVNTNRDIGGKMKYAQL